ncbi:conserved Plasmodium membrane protein, unknown function [Plasmodium gallinaceum]|uniref:Uncharacterized protein n=1 Tax=Plasmodium gallinaceum TaxID=5849 RepID=A0A1J1GRU5_PLAGA|nr:conserved Plasmodium membrane protein, unknown function [Plasmodium gallinaceum]CRG95190.1 conserved Plasmodium membrane protein, unknown function [Plasmodium gallinaceum]
MFRSIIPTTVGLNNSTYVHANIDEGFIFCNLDKSEINKDLENELNSSQNIINVANSYNINIENLDRCKTPEEIAIKILKSQNLENKRKYTDDNERCYHKNKKILNSNNEKIDIYDASNENISQLTLMNDLYADHNFQNNLKYFAENINHHQKKKDYFIPIPNYVELNQSLNQNSSNNYFINLKTHSNNLDNHNNCNNNSNEVNDHVINYVNLLKLTYKNQYKNFKLNKDIHTSCNNINDDNRDNFYLYNYVNNQDNRNMNIHEINKMNNINQLDEINKMNHVNQLDEINKMNHVNKLDEINKMNHVNKLDEINNINNVNQLDEINKMNNVNQLDEINKMNNVNQLNEINKMNNVNQLNDFNKMNNVNQLDEINKMNNINQLDEINKMNNINQLDEVNKMNNVNKLDEINKMNNVNQLDEINKMSETKKVNELNKRDEINKNENFNSDTTSIKEENIIEKNLVVLKNKEKYNEHQLNEYGLIKPYFLPCEKDNLNLFENYNNPLISKNTNDQISSKKKNSLSEIFEENINLFLNLNLIDINKNKKMKKIIISMEDCLKNDKNIIYDKTKKIETLFDKIFTNIKEFLSKDISYRKNEKTEIYSDEKKEKSNEQLEKNLFSRKKSKNYNNYNNKIMNNIIFGNYNILFYLILLNFDFLKKYLNTDELNEKALFNLKINLKNIIIKLCLNEVKNKVIEFYDIHESFLIQLNYIYEKCLLYIYDIYKYVERYDTILVNLIDLCLLSFQIHYNVQNIIVNSINILMKVYRNNNKKFFKKYIIDNLMLNINNINFKYNKLNFKNNNVNSTYIHLLTFFFIKIAESFSLYNDDLKSKFLLLKEKKKKNNNNNNNNNYNNDDDDDDEYKIENQENSDSDKTSNLTDETFNLSIFISENENDDNNNINKKSCDNIKINKKKKKKEKTNKIYSSKSNNTNIEKKYSLRKKKKNKIKYDDIFVYDDLNKTEELNLSLKIKKGKDLNNKKSMTIVKREDIFINNRKSDKIENEFKENSNESFNNFMMRTNFKRLNNVINYILIEMIEKILYGNNKNAKIILQYLVLDLIKCCDNPLFSTSILFIRNIIHIFFDIINKKHENSIKEISLFILRYIFKYIFNIYNYINYSCFHLLYNFNKELNKDKFIKPLFNINNLNEISENSFNKSKEIEDKNEKKKNNNVSFNLNNILNKEKSVTNLKEIQKYVKCCDETKNKEKMFLCLHCENYYHFTCIYKDFNKLNIENIMYEENEYFDKNFCQTYKKDYEDNMNNDNNINNNNEKNTSIINKKNFPYIIEYDCDNCKVKNIVKYFIIKETQMNNSFLNLKFKKKKEKNKGFYCYEKFINNLKIFVIYYYYILIHINKNRLSENVDKDYNNVYSYILILYNDFTFIKENEEINMNFNLNSKYKSLEKKKSSISIKKKKLEKKKKKNHLKKLNDFLIYEFKNANKRDEMFLSFSSAYNFDIYINSIWKLYLYFFFYDFFFLAFNQLFYILYENSNKNLRYYSISIINNIINDNYLYLKCKQIQNILLSCLTDNYLKVREYTLYIFYNFCKNFLEIELLINNYKRKKDSEHLEEPNGYQKNQSLYPQLNEYFESNNYADDKDSKNKESDSTDEKYTNKNNYEKSYDELDKNNHFNSYNNSIDLNDYITKDIVDSIKRCSKDIKISVRIISVKILKYIIYFNIYVKKYNYNNNYQENITDNKFINEKMNDINCEKNKQNSINDNILILNDIMERYVSTFDNDTMKNIILEILIEIFFINIFIKATKENKNALLPSNLNEKENVNENLHESLPSSIESEDNKSVDIEEDSNKYIKIKKNMYVMFIHLLYVMKNKHNINIINKMLAYIDKNMKKYEDKFEFINEILNENILEKNKKKLKKNENISGNKNYSKCKNIDFNDDYTDDEDDEDKKKINKDNNSIIIKNNIYNIYVNSFYKHLEVLNKKSIKYILEVWIYNLICLFIKSRRNNILENETKKIMNILNIIIEIIPGLFIKYVNFFYPYIYNNGVSKDVCELLSSIIPYCKYDLQLKLQFKKVNFNNSLLYHNNIFISRSYIHLLCTLHTYIFCNFVYFKNYIEECFIKLHKYKLCFLINNYIVQLNDFVREFYFMKQEEKKNIKHNLCELYYDQIKNNKDNECNSDDNNNNNNNINSNDDKEDHPNNYFIDNIIDIKYEEFICYLDQYKKHIFEMFSITQNDILNINKYAWFISVMFEFINMNKIIINDVYSEDVDENIHIQMKNLKEKKKIDYAYSLKSSSFSENNDMKYIKLSDIIKNIKIYSNGILYFEFIYNKQINYIKQWNILKLKNEIIFEIINKKVGIQKIEKFVDICNYKFYNLSLILVNLLIDMFYLSSDVKYKCFFLHCLNKILSNYYNSHFINDLKLRNVLFYCINSSNATLQRSLLYTLLQLIKTYEHFLSNKNNIFIQQEEKCNFNEKKSNVKNSLNNSKNSDISSLAQHSIKKNNDNNNIKKKRKDTNKNKKYVKNKGLSDEQTIIYDEKNKLTDSCNKTPDSCCTNLNIVSSNDNEQCNEITRKKKNRKEEKIKEEESLEGKETEVKYLNDDEKKKNKKDDKRVMECGKKKEINDEEQENENIMNMKNSKSALNSQNKDIIHVLLVASLFTQKIIDILMVNKFIYIECTDEELNFIKNLGVQILNHLYKEGFIQSSKISPSVFCLCFSSDLKLKLRSEKVINCIIEKENYNFLNNLAECLQYLLFYIIENSYMSNKTENINMNRLFLFSKMDSSFFKSLLDIYDNLADKRLKRKYLKIVLKEIENACHFVLYDKIKNFIRDVNTKYNTTTTNNNINNKNVTVEINQIKHIYSHIINNYIPLNDDQQEFLNEPNDSASNSSAINNKDQKRSKNKNFKENKQISLKSVNMKKEKNFTVDVSNISSSEENYNEINILRKVKKKYNHLLQHYMIMDEYSYINYFLFLYLQILIYLISYLNFTTYSEITLLIHDINKVYYIISSTINFNNDLENFKINKDSMYSLNEDMRHLTNDDEINNENFSLINLNLNKIKCFVIVLLNNLTNNLIKHYNIDTSKLNDLNEDEDTKENKIEDEKREEKKNTFNYYEYIYDCIEIFIEDCTTVIEKYSKFNLNIHNLNNDYLNKLINDGKNKKFLQKKRHKEVIKQKRLILKNNI